MSAAGLCRPRRLPLPPAVPAARRARARARRGAGARRRRLPGAGDAPRRGRRPPRLLPPPPGRLVRAGRPPARGVRPGADGDERAARARCSPTQGGGGGGVRARLPLRPRAARRAGAACCASSGSWRSSSACRSSSTTARATTRCWRWSREPAFAGAARRLPLLRRRPRDGRGADRARLLLRALRDDHLPQGGQRARG